MPLRALIGLAPADQRPFFEQGTWALSGPGGAGVLPFQLAFRLPRRLRLFGSDSLRTIRRGVDLSISWDPRGHGSRDIVWLSLANASGAIQCRTLAWSGSLTVPRSLLGRRSPANIPALLTLAVMPVTAARDQFAIPRPDDEPSRGTVTYNLSESFQVEIQ